MALSGEAILDRLRALLVDASGSFRVIPANTYEHGTHPDMSDDQLSTKALEAPRADVTLRVVGPNASRPLQPATMDLTDIEVKISIARHLKSDAKVDEAYRDTVAGLSAADADLLQGVLEWPDNLSRSTTGLLMLSYQTSDMRIAMAETGNVIVTEHTFNGIVQVTRAAS